MAVLPLWTSQELETVFDTKISGRWNSYGVSIDSRTIEDGDLFFALSGPNFDGHAYVKSAIDAGASGAVVSKVVDGVDQSKQVLVDDVMDALVKLGIAGRNRVNVPIIAVTGSVGKTGTKEALKAALSRYKKTHASVLSYNNDVGVPLSLARMPYDVEYGIFEMGMNHAGELEELVKLVRPDVAIITTVELAHSEFFENVEEIADAKAEIFTCMNNGGTAIINRDNPHFERLKKRAHKAGVENIITFGMSDDADVRSLRHYFHDTCTCIIADVMDKVMTYKVGMLGDHWVMNSLSVLAAVDAVGADLGLSGLGLAELMPLVGRGRRDRIYFDIGSDASFLLIDESYNANPASMRAAIKTLGKCENSDGGRKIAVLGDMAELGEQADELHVSLAPALGEAEIERVFVVGEHMKHLAEHLQNQYPAIQASYFNDKNAIERALLSDLKDGDIIMIKGSNSSGMSAVVKKLKTLDLNENRQVANG
ncbi:UDP-N-acetylmuramoylalanyl-D-glutamyl-2,6-diaminopimelate--D-alanyl-D-alanine ligase [Pseudemcibacter aquimaris]|uniref:UDP-N-acetylmuramoylalanyl-D-glutamyl-2, 6-diaminopimelate--D-alanyl-D-alanine ligase n=1 Tax=Pseudemcibacter aquimaris TaxID=2857064 RepID=UPI0020124187|nr:UDP-N-acetylmuramoylalanyl-D-glutamyl-2,6-diaminopimelate--D-alanyl-D-alanine ligase [Pseudemcibacter aquimaris]MCC3861371.1 UDP-N-acetylmuramoylalanyl-D-glutamyl-2,6-diaminopimelate--D-alanyl-D-alanine ligase [Pseudemcibacter aquimaris]WDU58143.1 UDP-N-acetylmuramoylalanyl-D-glutamyl-2,6-diaminopimelate--D-alanyl-D-alanine ligase [Pseudemcibacter aquimaris]